ncbi:hypothetical protein GUJ93_ZPchr0013g36349 [Zizania palustris]|uniref:Uncharacterized protein n=1 Tax=Zizania palustris TaxID=103762 RepID=A0A8J6BWQ7_ZIZPA|nr:hypothetical protein GUJ93_ZPchr0013g36349 [Zizania palustris]
MPCFNPRFSLLSSSPPPPLRDYAGRLRPPPRPPAASAHLRQLHGLRRLHGLSPPPPTSTASAASAHLRRLHGLPPPPPPPPPPRPLATSAAAAVVDLNNAIPHRGVIQALVDKFTASAARAGKVTVQPKQVRFPFMGDSAGFGTERVPSDLDPR